MTRVDDNQDSSDQKFTPSRAIVLSELNKDMKEQYFDLILANNVKLQYSDDKFVANVRLLAPAADGEGGSQKEISQEEGEVTSAPVAPKKCNSSLPLEQRIHRLQYGTTTKALTFQIAGVAHFDYSSYARFCSLIGLLMNESIHPDISTDC